MKPHPKLNNVDLKYRTHVGELCRTFRVGCFVCDKRGPDVVGHHVKAKQVNGDKDNILPLCAGHHVLNDDSAHALGSYRAFDMAHNIDSLAEAARLYGKYRRDVKGDTNV